MKLLQTSKRLSLLAVLVLAIHTIAASEHKSLPLSDKIISVSWKTNEMIDPNLYTVRWDGPRLVTNVATKVLIYDFGPGMPFYTNYVPFATNVVWKKGKVKPLKSPKYK